MLALILAMSVLVACGESEDGGEGNKNGGEFNPDDAVEFNAGNVSISVPSNWKAYPVSDMWSDTGANEPEKILLIKDAQSEFDQFTKPYINILYYCDEKLMFTLDDMKAMYTETEDIASFTTGEITWNGFINKTTNTAILISADEMFQLDISLSPAEGTISLEDKDVQFILGSIVGSPAENAA